MKTMKVDVQVLNVLKAVAQVAEERVVEMFQHAPFPDNVAYTLRPYDCGDNLSVTTT